MGDMQRSLPASEYVCARREWKDLVKITALAVAEGDCKTVKRILSKRPEVLQAHISHRMGLLSLVKGDQAMCQLLLDHGADISQPDAAGATPLIHAAAQGHTAVAQQLIDSAAAAFLGRQVLLQHTTNTGETAVMAAAKNGQLETLKLFVSYGARVLTTNLEGCSALHLACRHNQPAVLQYLIQQCNCSCNQPDHNGMTPMMIAAATGARKVVQLLLQNRQLWGVQLEGSDKAGDTVLVHAIKGNDPEVLEALTAAEIILEASWPEEAGQSCQSDGPRPLDSGRQNISHVNQEESGPRLEQQVQLRAAETALQRLQYPSLPEPTHQHCGSIEHDMFHNSKAEYAAKTATRGDSPLALTTVLDTAVSATSVGYNAETGSHAQDAVMYIAAAHGSAAVIEWLLRKGVGMGCVDAEDEHSAVFAAVKHGQINALHCLVQQTGCSLEPRDYRGWTPLMWAAAAGHNKMVRLLVQLGADMLAQDLNGHVARQVALESGMRATAELSSHLARHRLLM